jgi:hypothetical protein
MKYFFFFCYSCGNYWSYFYFLSKYLSFISQLLSFFKQVKVNFFVISNDSVTAKFLSRFIAKKLKQNYGLKEVLNPIKKELCIMSKFSKYSLNVFSRQFFKKSLLS